MSNITISNNVNTKHQTPIEIALQVNAEGKTTAKRLYEFLELDKTHYTRWCNINITNNTFADKNVDYEVLAIKGENHQSGRPTTDYTLTATFAKKLAMGCQNKRGDEAMLLNAKNRTYKTLMSSIDGKNLSPIAIQVFGLKGLESTFGVEVGNCLPKVEKTLTATEIGAVLGLSANMVGSIAKKNNLKTDEFGVWVMDKSPYSSKEVPNFRYYEKVIDKFKELIS